MVMLPSGLNAYEQDGREDWTYRKPTLRVRVTWAYRGVIRKFKTWQHKRRAEVLLREAAELHKHVVSCTKDPKVREALDRKAFELLGRADRSEEGGKLFGIAPHGGFPRGETPWDKIN